MGGFKLTGLAAATAAADSARLSTVQNSQGQQLGTIAGTNTITAVGSPTVTAYAAGQTFRFTSAGANTGATTLNVDSLGAKNVYWSNAACTGGEIANGATVTATYDGTQFQLATNYSFATATSVQNSQGTLLGTIAGTNTITAAATPTLTAYTAGQTFRFSSAGANTGATTLNINSLGAKNIFYIGSALVGSEIPASGMVTVTYDGTQFNLTASAAAGSSPFTDATAIIKNSVDATKLIKISAASVTTATTRTITGADRDQNLGTLLPAPTNNNGKVLQTDGSVNAYANANPPVRQTVLSGTVDANGLPNFGGSTGSGTVTQSNTLIVTASNGQDISGAVNRTGSKTNPSWTGLTTNGTMYLGVTVNADGTLTEFSTTLAPTYQWGGTYSTTSNQRTFNIQEMTMKVGSGAAAAQAYDVFVGEVSVAGAVVSAITWYALMARYDSGFTATFPGTATQTIKNSNLGIKPFYSSVIMECTTIDLNYAAGDQLLLIGGGATSTVTPVSGIGATTNTVWFTTPPTAIRLPNKTNGDIATNIVLASWKYKLIANRGW